MALINCKECNQEISSKAEKCPNCGCPIKKKGFFTGCFMVFLGLIIPVMIFFYFDSSGTASNVINDEKTYSENWRSPYGTEYGDIGKIIVQNGIKVCGEYYVKEIQTNEYVIACSANGTTWDYFVVYTSLGKIYRANDEMESKLYPPR